MTRALWTSWCIAWALTAGACVEQRIVYDGWERWRSLSQTPQPQHPPGSTSAVQAAPTAPSRPPPSSNPLDLSRHPGMYSLQIGFYDDAFGPDFRQAAEQAAATLHQQGEQAYFYHGPNRSLVTIGLFTENDFVQQGPERAYGPQIKQLQQRFPYNLANGLTQIQKIDGRTIGEQPSFIVRVR